MSCDYPEYVRGRHGERGRWLRTRGHTGLALAAAAVLGAALVPLAARAAPLTASTTSLGGDTGSIPECGAVSGLSARSGYVGSRYQVTSVVVGTVPVACQGKDYRLTLYDLTTGTSFVELTGVLPAAATAQLPVPVGAGPDLATIPGAVGVAMVVSS